MENNKLSKTAPDDPIAMLLGSGVKLFHDQYNDPYMSPDGTGKQVFLLGSQGSRSWLGHFFYKSTGKVLSTDQMTKLVNTLSGIARFDSEEKELHLRAIKINSHIHYDLGSGAVLVGAAGWSIFDDPAVVFRRFPHQRVQVSPADADNIGLIRKYINLSNDDDYLLFLVYLVAAFIPGFPHPILVLHGAQGAGKTTPMRILKELIDPSHLQGMPAPLKPEDFVHVASKHFFLFFDNLSAMPLWLSDTLARAVTGDGFSKRALYSNDDDVIYHFQRTMAINGINQVITRSDLLDRAILLDLERIPESKRIQESEFWNSFNADKSAILGSVFSVLSRAMAVHPGLKLEKLPRMADFYLWGCAITEALGRPKEDFINAYQNNINNQNDEAIEASPVAMAIIKFMESKDVWEGTATDLLGALNVVSSTVLKAKSADLPPHPNWLSRNLTLLQPNLLANGIKLARVKNARPRKLRLEKFDNSTVDADIPLFTDRQHDGTDDKIQEKDEDM